MRAKPEEIIHPWKNQEDWERYGAKPTEPKDRRALPIRVASAIWTVICIVALFLAWGIVITVLPFLNGNGAGPQP